MMPKSKNLTLSDHIRRWLLGYSGRKIPLKDPPLRVPGQGLSTKLDEITLDVGLKFGACLCMPILVAVVFVINLFRTPLSLNLLFCAILGAMLAIPFAILVSQIRRHGRDLHSYRIGLLCERYVGQQLERCRYMGYSVFHDIEAEGANRPFNIDHVLIGPGGVLVFDTKGRTQAQDEEWVIRYNGKTLTTPDGYESSTEVEQARAIADYVRRLLQDLLAEQRNPVCQFTKANPIPVRAFLVYPGWRIDFTSAKGAEVTVLAGSAMVDYIKGSPIFLKDKEYIELRELLGKRLRDERRHLLED